MMDYFLLWPSEFGRKYVLLQVNKMAKQVEVTATYAPTAVPACQAVLWWGSRYGLPEWIISDGGSHFANHALELVTKKLGVQHHITLAHCPWANGSVEVAGRELIRTVRAMLSEFKLGLEKWEEVLPLIQLTLNHILRKTLGDRCAIHVMVGQNPAAPVDLVLWTGKLLKDATSVEVELDVLETHCAGLAEALSVMHEEVKDANMLKARKQAAKEARDKQKGAVAFNVGDLVMVAAVDNAANIIQKSKMMVTWQGPYDVVRRASVVEYDVRLLGDPVDRVNLSTGQ